MKKYFFCFPDLRNFYVIRYFTNCTKGTNKRLFPLCGSCGFVSKKPNHGANKCTKLLTEEKRNDIIGQIEAIFIRNNLETKDTLYEYLQAIYYTMDDVIKKDRTRLIEILKTTITNLIRNDESRNKLDIIEEQPEEYEKMVDFIKEVGEDNETMYKIIPELESESKEESESEDENEDNLNN